MARGGAVPDGGGHLALRQVTSDSVLRLPPAVRKVIYTDQCDREHQRAAAQDHQNARAFPQRRRGQQNDLACGSGLNMPGWCAMR